MLKMLEHNSTVEETGTWDGWRVHSFIWNEKIGNKKSTDEFTSSRVCLNIVFGFYQEMFLSRIWTANWKAVLEKISVIVAKPRGERKNDIRATSRCNCKFN